MPTYDYECDACGHTFQLFQTMSAKVRRKCPSCGKPKLQRLIGPGAGFVFKGSGFYITDYRKDSYRKAESGDKTEKTDRPGKSDAPRKPDGGDGKKGSDAKPAAKDGSGRAEAASKQRG